MQPEETNRILPEEPTGVSKAVEDVSCLTSPQLHQALRSTKAWVRAITLFMSFWIVFKDVLVVILAECACKQVANPCIALVDIEFFVVAGRDDTDLAHIEGLEVASGGPNGIAAALTRGSA